MKRLSRMLQSTGVAMILAIGIASPVRAADLPNGGHIGFVVNRPTTVKLQALFPDDAGARTVTEPVYIGGPQLVPGLFVIAREAPEGSSAVPLMPGLVALIDKETIDHVIATTPNDVRYFLGLKLWDADELEDQVDQGAWEVRPADVDTVLRAKAPGLWNSLRGPWVNLDMGARVRAAG
jgi:putative AlgH/UPF0301 family transcriptional regulator